MILEGLTLGALVGLDQSTKANAREKYKGKSIVKGPLTFRYVTNKGAFRGLLKDKVKILKIIQAGMILLLMYLLIIEVMIRKNNQYSSIGLILLLAGAMGNFIDRMKDGKVTDFFAIKATGNLYYNLADMYVFAGAIIFVIDIMIGASKA